MSEQWLFEQNSIDWQALSTLYRIAPLGDKSADERRAIDTGLVADE
jgi:hypothetical protein